MHYNNIQKKMLYMPVWPLCTQLNIHFLKITKENINKSEIKIGMNKKKTLLL